MDNRLKQDALLEDALRSQALVPMPRNITPSVMEHIRKDVRPVLIMWNDFALSIIIVLCIGALFFSLQNLPPIILAKAQILGILLYQDLLVNFRWLVPAIFFALAALLYASTIPSLLRMTADRRR